MNRDAIRQAVQELLPQAQQFLCDIMKFPSTSGMEHEEMLFIEQAFRRLPAVEVERIPLSNAIRKDPDFSSLVFRLDHAMELSKAFKHTAKELEKGTGSMMPDLIRKAGLNKRSEMMLTKDFHRWFETDEGENGKKEEG